MNDLDRTREDRRKAILRAEEALLTLPQIPLNPIHYFAKGLVARELFMPKGSVVTGKIHVQEHLVIIIYGDVTVTTDDGTQRYVGPCTFVGKPGSKRALLMHEDTLWVAIHASDAKTQEEAESILVTNSYNDFLRVQEDKKCLIS
jgi:quercetin dioxygenase-like cupin family protein